MRKDVFLCTPLYQKLYKKSVFSRFYTSISNYKQTLDRICKIMGEAPEWLPGIILRADGYECSFYMKD